MAENLNTGHAYNVINIAWFSITKTGPPPGETSKRGIQSFYYQSHEARFSDLPSSHQLFFFGPPQNFRRSQDRGEDHLLVVVVQESAKGYFEVGILLLLEGKGGQKLGTEVVTVFWDISFEVLYECRRRVIEPFNPDDVFDWGGFKLGRILQEFSEHFQAI